MTVNVPHIDSLKTLAHRGYLRELGIPVLVVAIAMLLSAVMLLGVNVSTMRENFEWVQQSDDVLLQLSDVESGVIGDELSVRGYALTNDPRFLAYQGSNLRRAWDSLSKLNSLVAGDASQSARYAQLHDIVVKHTRIFAALTRLGPGHAQDVASAILDINIRTVMDQFRAQLASFRTYELTELAKRQADAAGQASRTYALAVGIVVAAFLLGGLGLLVSQYGRRAG